MLTIPAPAQRDGIGQALADALAIDVFDVSLVGDELRIDVDEAREPEARAFVEGYTPPPAPPDPDDEFDSALTAAAAKGTVEEKVDAVIAALRGVSGPGAQARQRP